MRSPHRLLTALAASSLVLAACGGGSDEESTDVDTTAAPAEEAPAEEPVEEEPVEDAPVDDEPVEDEPVEEAPVEEAPVEEEPVEEAPEEDEPAEDESAVGAVVASLIEWAIEAPTEYAAGTVTFTASNDGSFPHELVVIRGDGYASLPLTDSGAVIEDELPEGALIGRTARIGGGSTEDLVVDLEPGNYVLLCNLGGGSNSHAGQGQNLDIVVS